MSIIDWLMLIGFGVIGTLAFLCILAVLGILRWWFGSIRDELT